VSRVLTAIVAVALLALALAGCAGTPTSPDSTDAAVEATLPVAEPDVIVDYIPARIAAAKALPEGISGGDLAMISTRPEVPDAWFETHQEPPYMMIHLRLEEGGTSPGRFDAWPAVASEGDTWTCDIVVPDVP